MSKTKKLVRKLPPKRNLAKKLAATPMPGLGDLAREQYQRPQTARVLLTGGESSGGGGGGGGGGGQTMLVPLHHDHPLRQIFDDALAQVARGKGQVRHGRGDDFMAQHWRSLAREHGPGFLSGQAEKKLREALALPHAQRREELLGVLAYAAMTVLHFDLEFKGR